MKIKIKLQLKENIIPKDYRRMSLHFIKTILEEEDEQLFQKYYKIGENMKKPFTFWVVLPKCNFGDKIITLDNNTITLYISTTNTKLAFVLYNGFSKAKKLTVGKNNKVESIQTSIEKEKQVLNNEILINMQSPLVVRKHIKGEKDGYYLFNEENFQPYFEMNIKAILAPNERAPSITPIIAKKVIVQAYGTNIPASLGSFKLEGDIDTLQMLYINGLGAKTSAGFGKFEIIG